MHGSGSRLGLSRTPDAGTKNQEDPHPHSITKYRTKRHSSISETSNRYTLRSTTCLSIYTIVLGSVLALVNLADSLGLLDCILYPLYPLYASGTCVGTVIPRLIVRCLLDCLSYPLNPLYASGTRAGTAIPNLIVRYFFGPPSNPALGVLGSLTPS